MNTLGEKLKELRKKKGISQEQLAERCGVSVQAVSKWECELSYPDIKLLPIIADFFEVTIDYLVREGDKIVDADDLPLPDDGKLRIVQCRGRAIQLWQSAQCNGDIRHNDTI